MAKIHRQKWIIEGSDGTILRLYIQPKASRSEIFGIHGEGESVRLKIRIAAPPIDGAANDELIRFLKKTTGIPTSRLHLIRGEASRLKDILLQGVSMEEVVGVLCVLRIGEDTGPK